MQKKFFLAACIVCTGLVLTVYSFASAPVADEAAPAIQTEQVSTVKDGHCDPSDCTPEKAAACPYTNKTAATTDASASVDCPATKDCPPSKCEPKGNKATI